MTTGKAPTSLTLIACPTCGRTDRFSILKPRHFAGSGLCPGPLVRITYDAVAVERL